MYPRTNLRSHCLPPNWSPTVIIKVLSFLARERGSSISFIYSRTKSKGGGLLLPVRSSFQPEKPKCPQDRGPLAQTGCLLLDGAYSRCLINDHNTEYIYPAAWNLLCEGQSICFTGLLRSLKDFSKLEPHGLASMGADHSLGCLSHFPRLAECLGLSRKKQTQGMRLSMPGSIHATIQNSPALPASVVLPIKTLPAKRRWAHLGCVQAPWQALLSNLPCFSV